MPDLGRPTGRWRRSMQAGAAICALVFGMPVAVVAHELGFAPSALSTFFKARVGSAPNRWRANQAAPAGERIE